MDNTYNFELCFVDDTWNAHALSYTQTILHTPTCSLSLSVTHTHTHTHTHTVRYRDREREWDKETVLSPSITSIKKQMERNGFASRPLPPTYCLTLSVKLCLYLSRRFDVWVSASMCVYVCVCVCVCVSWGSSNSTSPDRTLAPTAKWEQTSAEGSEDRGEKTRGEEKGDLPLVRSFSSSYLWWGIFATSQHETMVRGGAVCGCSQYWNSHSEADS